MTPDKRLVFESGPYPKGQRLIIWLRSVFYAITTPPAKNCSRFIEVFKGDPRYEDAMYGVGVGYNMIRIEKHDNKDV